MLKFIKFLLNEFKDSKIGPQYDEDGNYIDPTVGKLTDAELLIPAEKARILHSKSLEEVKIKARKKVFAMIHAAIKKGKTSVRMETYILKPEMIAYLDSLGYTVQDIIPANNNQFGRINFDENDEPLAEPQQYHYYMVHWGDPQTTAPAVEETSTGTAVVTHVDVAAGIVTLTEVTTALSGM